MVRLLVTGMSGVGKSSVLRILGERGYTVVDTDYGDWKTANGLWDDGRMSTLLSDHDDVVVSGTVENQGAFYDRFDHVVLLAAPLPIIVERISTRTTNSYGRSPTEIAEIIDNVHAVEPLLRSTATIELDATEPLLDVVAQVETLLQRPRFT